MKSKNLVSLSVAACFTVLATTGLLIYFGQGNHFIDHIHAWMGVLFASAAVFHIINNWGSIKGYSINRKEGGFRRELLLPVVIVLLFTVGIAADLPVFKELANAGKRAFGPSKKPQRGLSQPIIDSIARKLTADYYLAFSQGDTATLTRIVTENALIGSETGTITSRNEVVKLSKLGNSAAPITIRLQQATALDDHVILATGIANATRPGSTPIRFTNVLNEAEGHWRIAASQLTQLPDSLARGN